MKVTEHKCAENPLEEIEDLMYMTKTSRTDLGKKMGYVNPQPSICQLFKHEFKATAFLKMVDLLGCEIIIRPKQ